MTGYLFLFIIIETVRRAQADEVVRGHITKLELNGF